MKLNLKERLTLLKILPEKGNFATLKVVNNLRLNLSLNEEKDNNEFEKYDVKQNKTPNGIQLSWNEDEGKKEVEIEIGEKATDLIVDTLKKLDKEGQLTNDEFSLYEKFIGD